MANLKDYSGTKLGFLKIIEKCNSGEKQTQSNTMWRCFCEGCNTETFVSHKLISSKKKTTCGCGIKTNKYSPGNKYGLLTIVKEGERDNVSKTRRVWCICDCGNEELTLVRTNNLSSGNTTSCGCVGIKNRIKHGRSGTREYSIWEGMIRRCSPRMKDKFPRYAGRGISVCDSWKKFENFYSDMGDCPEGYSLDRIDYDGNYEPLNCRWTSNSVQGYNKGLDPNNTSGKTGVSFYSNQNKWSAEIHVNNKHIRLGMFENFEDAVKAREEAELKYYGWKKR